MRGFEEVRRIATAFRSFKAPWWFSGGWAIDLYLGRVTREHHDVDVTVLRRDQDGLRAALSGFELKKIVPHPGGVPGQGTITAWAPSERLELPIHQANAYAIGKSELSFQIMLNDTDGTEWWYRRDRRIRRPMATLGFESSEGVSYLAPEITILFKAKTMRPCDEADFEAVLPMLTGEARDWLRGALALAHPNHPWIARLG